MKKTRLHFPAAAFVPAVLVWILLAGCAEPAPALSASISAASGSSSAAHSSSEAESEDTYSTEEETSMLKIQVGDQVFTAALAQNSSVDAFKELLADGPLTLAMNDYAGMEKGADLGVSLPQNNQSMQTEAGDIILYQGRTFVIYYDTNSWSLTPLAQIQDTDAETLRRALGKGDVTVTLWLE